MTFLQQASDTSDLTTYTFSTQNFGTAAADRYIICSIQSRDTGTNAKTIDSVTIGGVTATIVVQVQGASSAVNSCISGIAIAAVPTGTSGDVVVTFSEAMLRANIALYAATNINPTAADFGSSTSDTPSYAIDVPAGGFAITAAASANSTSATWTNITENYDATVESFLLVTGASDTFASTQTNLALSASFAGTITDPATVFASWGLGSTTSTSTTSTSSSTSKTTSSTSTTSTSVTTSSTSTTTTLPDFSQPALPTYDQQGGWLFNAIDFQILTKSEGWNQDQTKRLNEYQEGLNKHMKYVGLAVPYDNPTKFTNYVNDARTKGLKIIFRSHWNAWEGDNSVGSATTITRSGTTATCTTSTSHLMATADRVVISGANQAQYNGEFAITVTGATSFTYTISSDPGTDATGTLKWRFARATYLRKTQQFILDNSSLFQAGDMFATCVECNNADNNANYTFRAGGLSGGGFSMSTYNQFLKDQVSYANAALNEAGVSGVYTWPISFTLSLLDLAGQTLDSGDGGNASGLDDSDITTYFDGFLSIDHYMSDAYRDTDNYGTKYASDLEKIHTAFPNATIMISEWGYHTTTSTTDDEQEAVYADVIDTALRAKSYIVGVSFWNHLGQTSSSLWTDTSGTINPGGRDATAEVSRAFSTSNAAFTTTSTSTSSSTSTSTTSTSSSTTTSTSRTTSTSTTSTSSSTSTSRTTSTSTTVSVTTSTSTSTTSTSTSKTTSTSTSTSSSSSTTSISTTTTTSSSTSTTSTSTSRTTSTSTSTTSTSSSTSTSTSKTTSSTSVTQSGTTSTSTTSSSTSTSTSITQTIPYDGAELDFK